MIAIGAYAVFLALATALAVKVGLLQRRHHQESRRSGAAAGGSRMLSVAGLAVLGFGLVAAGTIVLLGSLGSAPSTMTGALLFVATRLAVLSIVLGVTHFKCLTLLTRTARLEGGLGAGPTPDARRPRQGREDPLDRVFEAVRLDAPSGL